MGDLVLFPTHPLFVQLKHPSCTCGREILAGQPVVITEIDGGKLLYQHKECVVPANDPQPA